VHARTAAIAVTLGCTVAALSAATGPASAAGVLRPATALTIESQSSCTAIGSDDFVCGGYVDGGQPPYNATWNGHSTGTFQAYESSSWGGTCTGNQLVHVTLVVTDNAGTQASEEFSFRCISGIVPQ
jgi:hypothetical protein